MANYKNLIISLIILAVFCAIAIIIPDTLILGARELGNTEYQSQLSLFSRLFLAGAIITMCLTFARFFMQKDNKYTNSFGFYDIGDVFPFFKRFTTFQLTLGFAIIFSTVFLGANILKVGGFTSASVLPQTFTPVQSLSFSTLLIPISEEMMAIGIIGILVMILIFLAIKYNMQKSEFLIYYLLLIPLIIGGIAIIWHNTAYANSDIGLGIVFLFWTIKTFLVLATGFFVVGWLLHLNNNFFIDFTRLFSSDVVLWSAVSVIVGMIALYIFLYRNSLFGSTKTIGDNQDELKKVV